MRYGFTKNSPHISYRINHNVCADKLPAATTVYFLWAKWFVHACHYKGFPCSNYKVKVNANSTTFNGENFCDLTIFTQSQTFAVNQQYKSPQACFCKSLHVNNHFPP